MTIELIYVIIFGVLLLLSQVGGGMLIYHFWWRQKQFAVRQDQLEELIRSLSPSMVFKMEKEFGTKVRIGDPWEQEWDLEDVEEAEKPKPFDPFEKEHAPWT